MCIYSIYRIYRLRIRDIEGGVCGGCSQLSILFLLFWQIFYPSFYLYPFAQGIWSTADQLGKNKNYALTKLYLKWSSIDCSDKKKSVKKYICSLSYLVFGFCCDWQQQQIAKSKQQIVWKRKRGHEKLITRVLRAISLSRSLALLLSYIVCLLHTWIILFSSLSLSASSNCILSSSVLFCYCFVVSLPPSHSLSLSTSFSALSSILLLIIFVHCTLSPCLYLLPFFLAKKKCGQT